jgi:hypothetical protein
MVDKIRGAAVAPNLVDGISAKFGEPATGVVSVGDNVAYVRRARLTLTNFAIAVLAANDYGGSKLLDLPDRNIMLLGMEVDCVVTKQGNTNGIVAATDINMSIGTGVAAATPLAGTAIDVIESTAMTADALAVDFEKHSNDQSTISFPKKLADSATLALFMNITGAITADSSVSVTGIIDIFYIDLGNLSS